MTDPYLEPAAADSPNESWAVAAGTQTTPIMTKQPAIIDTAIVPPHTIIGSFETAAETTEKTLVSFKDHALRMMQTAGHSWTTTEHDVLYHRFLNRFFGPMHRLANQLGKGLHNSVPDPIKNKMKKPKVWAPAERWQVTYFGLLTLAIMAVPAGVMAHASLQAQRYELSSSVKKLVGEPVVSLNQKLKFNEKINAFQYNTAAADGTKTISNNGDTGKQVGSANYYGVDLAQAASKGQTFTDAATKLSFGLVPQFGGLNGKQVAGHIVYPIDVGQAVYTLKDNGLKEDVVLSTPTAGATLRYKLQLPETLQARLETDGSIGIYSADPSLFGNISYGSDQDQATVQKARTSGQKMNLVFMIPAPIITESGKAASSGKASFQLNGNELTVTASNLQNLSYPISIDPSVVVQSANSFLSGNSEDGDAVITASSVTRASLTGATISGGWTSAGTLASTMAATSSAVVNGYLYVLGSPSSGSSIQFAKINTSTGNVGTLTAVSAGTPYDAREASIAGYNGFLYVTGGINTANNTAYGKLGAAGDITSWTTGPTLTAGRTDAVTVAYNKRLYVGGGCTSQVLGCSGQTASIESATINADGSISSWSTTGMTTLPYAAYGLRMLAANGKMYALEGRDNNSNYYGGVYYATVNADGTIGAWTATTSLPVASAFSGVTISNNYLYVLGGEASGGAQSTTYVAPLYASGAVGNFQAITSLSKVWSVTSSVSYGGLIYLIGGQNGTLGTTGATSYSDIISAKIDAVGPIGQYISGGTYDTTANAVSQACSAVYNGYIYIIGGNSAGSVSSAAIRYAKLNSDGSVGTWAATTKSLLTPRSGCGAAVNNGYLYVAAGVNSTSSTNGGYLADVEYVKLGTSGDITTSFTDNVGFGSLGDGARQYIAVVANNNYLYAIGGRFNTNSNSSSNIDYAPLSTTDGSIGTWNLTTMSLPAQEALGAATVYNNYLYFAGGINSSGNSSATNYIRFAANGDLTASWGTGPTLATGRYGLSLTASKGFLYYAAGIDSTNVNSDTRYTPINSNGSLGASWIATNSFSTARYSANTILYNDNLYIIGGCTAVGLFTYGCNTNSTLNDVQYAPLNNGGPGTAGTWKTSSPTPLATNTIFNSSFIYNGNLYNFDGRGGTTTNIMVPIKPDGTVGTAITINTPNNQTNEGIGAYAVYNGYVYKAAGTLNGTFYNDVQYAAVCTGTNTTAVFPTNCSTSSTPGTLSGWSYTSAFANNGTTQAGGLITAKSNIGLAAANGYLYVVGGCTHANTLDHKCDTLTNAVEVAQISSTNGTVGSWSTTTGIPTAREDVGIVSYNGYVYVGGGCAALDGTSRDCANSLNDIQYLKATVSGPATDSGCGNTWCQTGSFTTGRYAFSLTASNGNIYAVGGANNATLLNDSQSAPLLSNGQLGTWTISPNTFTTARFRFGSAISGSNLYIVGGCTSFTGCSATANSASDIQFAGLQSMPRVAHYSRLLDLASTINGNGGGDTQVTRTNLIGTGTTANNGQSPVSLCRSAATTTNVIFGSAVCNYGGGFGYINTRSFGRYSFLYVTLDDSQTATFPESVTPTSLTEIDAYFHAAPGRRLRGGQTFTDMSSGSNVVNQLDTEGP